MIERLASRAACSEVHEGSAFASVRLATWRHRARPTNRGFDESVSRSKASNGNRNLACVARFVGPQPVTLLVITNHDVEAATE